MAAFVPLYCSILVFALPAVEVSALNCRTNSSSSERVSAVARRPKAAASYKRVALPVGIVGNSTFTVTPHRRNSFWARHFFSGKRNVEDVRWINNVQNWRWHHPHYNQKPGILHFFSSAVAFEWVVFITAVAIFVLLSICLFDWPSKRWYHALALFIWFAAAGAYCMVIWFHLGPTTGADWLVGYFLEFVFSIENVFIYHIVVEAFQVPRKPAQKALFIVVCCQALFQMVFFMGLANKLESIRVLPYILGLWLLYVGVQSLREGDHTTFNGKESIVFRICHSILGGRLSPTYKEDRVLFWEDGRIRATLLLPATACLLLVDFVMEVDVTLTKIEEIDNHYIGFTSSVAAAFAVPELFFVARDLFKRFSLLKYGVSFVLLFFGCELLMCSWIHIPDMVGVVIIAAVMVVCAVLSKHLGYECRNTEDSEPEAHEKTAVDDQPVAKGNKDIPVEVERNWPSKP